MEIKKSIFKYPTECFKFSKLRNLLNDASEFHEARKSPDFEAKKTVKCSVR